MDENISELETIKNRIYGIAQEYGNNTKEKYILLIAYGHIYDAVEILKKKIPLEALFDG